jgi:hypothetical protein
VFGRKVESLYRASVWLSTCMSSRPTRRTLGVDSTQVQQRGRPSAGHLIATWAGAEPSRMWQTPARCDHAA